MAEDVKLTHDELQLVVFRLGNEEFGVEIRNVQEIIRMTSITKIPQVSDYVKGIINLRGRIIVVINLNVMLGLVNAEGQEQDEKTRIVVSDVGGTVVGFMVDSVSEVIRLPSKDIEPAPAMIANRIGTEYLRGVGKMDNRLLILLKLDKVISMDKMSTIQKIPAEKAPSAS